MPTAPEKMTLAERTAWEKNEELRRLLEDDPLFPVECHRIVKLVGRPTAEDATYSITAKDLYRQMMGDFSPAPPSEVKKHVTDVVAIIKSELKKAKDRLEAKGSPFHLLVEEGNNRHTGIRMKFVKVPQPKSRQVAGIAQRNDQAAVSLWRWLIDVRAVRKVLLIYDAPHIGPQDGQSETLGLWSRSGDVAAVFYVGQVLFHLDRPLEALRWRDMRHSDLTGENQLLLLIGNAAHPRLATLRRRDGWILHRSFVFEDRPGAESCGRIRDLRSVEGAHSRVFENQMNASGAIETAYALVFSYRCFEYMQELLGIMGTTSSATRAAAVFMTRDDHAIELERFLPPRTESRPRAVEVLLQIKLRDGIHEEISPVDAVVYDA